MYIKAIADLEDFMGETIKTEKESKKKMNATNGRALNSIKQRIRKNNRTYEDQIAKYRADPEAFEKEPEATPEPVAAPKRKSAAVEAAAAANAAIAAGDAVDEGEFSTIGRGGRTVAITPESIFKQLRAILEARGKKNTDRAEQIRSMDKMLGVAATVYQRIRVLLVLISTRFDLTTASASYMPIAQWKAAQEEISKLLETLEANPQYAVTEDAEEIDDEESEAEPVPKDGEPVKIFGSIASLIERLDDEFTRSLQNIDPHTPEYIDRLKEEAPLYATAVRAQLYFERLSHASSISRVLMRRLEMLYYKPEQLIKFIEQTTWTEALPSGLESKITPYNGKEQPSELMHSICTVLYKQDNRLYRTRAMLCEVYHHALHNRYFHARDLLLMSHLQATIHTADISTQILYNRTLVQVGLCAFREGMISEAQQALQEISGTGRVKELLAQGVQMQRYGAPASPEQERIERQRQIPFHQHINLELLECVYLTASMLLEIPFMAQCGSAPDAKKRVISKPFRRMLDYHERQVFTGPPENTRDHIMQASKALASGDWARAKELIRAIKIWELMPETEQIKDMLSEKIQEEGLRTYLFTYAPFYETLAISQLAGMFDVSERKATALVSKMISSNEVAAALDQKTNAIVFTAGVEYSRLQNLALALSDKAVQLLDSYKYR